MVTKEHLQHNYTIEKNKIKTKYNMKQIQKLVLMIVGMAIFFACNTNHSKGELKLNNGEKWKVNEEMKPHIEKGNEILKEFISKQDQDYRKLAESLKEQNNALIKSCTMKGESHDELHKWLHPHMELIKKLSNVRDSKEAGGIISELEKSFETYYIYFQ
ncbi:MAG: hypothetical protein IT272_02045 [Chitinophagales bacterium]|nr:hypothetical protein [Chitinophagales bacterium]HMS50766.1 hypothetical protein [Chitinophagales bacterium]